MCGYCFFFCGSSYNAHRHTVDCARISNVASVMLRGRALQHCGKNRRVAKSASSRVVSCDLLAFRTAKNCHLRLRSVICRYDKARFRNIAEILAPIPPTTHTHIKAICPPFPLLIRKPFSIPIIAVLEPLPERRLSPYRFPGVTPNSISRLSTGLRKNPDFLFVVN